MVPQRDDLDYAPADDQVVIEELDKHIGQVLRSMRKRGLLPFVGLKQMGGRLILRISLSRVTLALTVRDIEESWLLLARAVEFEMFAAPDIPQLRNVDFTERNAEAA